MHATVNVYAVDPWKNQSSTMEACNLAIEVTSRSMEHATCRDHGNRTMEASKQQARSMSGSYPAAVQAVVQKNTSCCIEAKQNNAHV